MANILVVDDDKEIRDLIKIILTNENHNVSVATDGQDGILAYKTQKFDLIITDIIMPNRDGIDLIVDILSGDNQTPIVAMSGGKRISDPDMSISEKISDQLALKLRKFNLDSASNLGIDETLKKPFTVVELLTVVNKMLAKN